jgi:cytochrome c biogenesis protein CcmG, thiol:disulfide interchange protein DsbE
MKKIIPAVSFVLVTIFSFAQNDLPPTKIKSLNGKDISFSSLGMNSDTAIIVSFWATWCIPCIQELETIAEQYEARQTETPFKLIAISVDDSRTTNRVKPFVKGRGWPFDIYLDVNSDLKRALNINDVPHVLIIKAGKIVYQHNGYVAGNEEVLFEKLRTNQ